MVRTVLSVLASTSVAVTATRFHTDAPAVSKFDMSCFLKEDTALESGGAKGRSYRGLVSSTASGRTCQKWTEIHPWAEAADHSPVADRKDGDKTVYGNGIGNHNYCRNPDSSMDKPWCFTMDTNEKHKKEVCEIPECPSKQRDFSSEADDLALKVSNGLDCKCAAQLYGSTTTTKNTAVPLNLLENATAVKTKVAAVHEIPVASIAVGKDKHGRPCTCGKVSALEIHDPCANIQCAANLKCPGGFAATKVEGHCCPYCVNPNIKVEAAVTGATGHSGGKPSTFCKDVWCFPTSCKKALAMPTTTNGKCCPTCPAL